MKSERKNPGIMAVDDKYEMTAHILSRDKSCWTYCCKYRLTRGVRCPATARVVQLGEKWILQMATDIHTCEPSRPRVIAEKLKAQMKELVRNDPVKPVSQAAKQVRIEAAEIYASDPEFYQHLLLELGSDSALEKQLLRVRYEIVGETPKSRNFITPNKFFSEIYGSKHGIIVGDSDELGSNWRSEIEKTNPNSEYSWQNMNDEIINMENDGEITSNLCDENDQENDRPKRVLLFTSLKLLKLLEKGKKTSVDGTFKSSPKFQHY